MFITQIDKIVNQILDDFYFHILEHKNNEINDIVNAFDLGNYFTKVNKEKKQYYDTIINIISSYIYYYVYLWYINENKLEDIKLKLVEFKKENDCFLNAVTIENLYIYYTTVGTLIDELDETDKKKYIDSKSKTYAHNLIKLIILRKVNVKDNRLELFNAYQNMKKTETKIIDIVVNKKNMFNYFVIQSILKDNEISNESDILNIYKFIHKYANEKINRNISNSTKAKLLLKSKYVIPISSDFLRFHKDDFVYIEESNKKIRKIDYAVDFINNIKQLYNGELSDVKREQIYSKIIDPERMSVHVNVMEDVRIINRIYNDFKEKKEITEKYYPNFMENISYAYLNFDDNPPNINGIKMIFDETTDMIRYTNIVNRTQISKYDIEKRVSMPLKTANIVGILIPHTDIKNISADNLVLSNDYDEIKNKLKDITDGKQLNKSIYWIFDKKEDTSSKFVIDKLGELYDYLLDRIYKIIQIATGNKVPIAFYDLIIKKVKEKYYKINLLSDDFLFINQQIYNNSIIRIKPEYDTNEDKLILLENYSHHIDYEPKINTFSNSICQHILSWREIKLTDRNKPIFNIKLHNFIKQFAVRITSGENTIYHICKSCSAILKAIIKYEKEGLFDEDGHYISDYMELRINLDEMPYYSVYSELIDLLDRRLQKISEILNISYLINDKRSRDTIIKQVIDVFLLINDNINFNNILLKQELSVLDKNYKEILKTDKTSKETIEKEYDEEINKLKQKYIFNNRRKFGISDSILFYVKDDKISNNILIAYLVAVLIINLSSSDILLFNQTEKNNFYVFEKFKDKLFNKLTLKKINTSKSDDITDLLSMNILSFVIYSFSGYLLINNLWETDDGKLTINNQKQVIHTILDVMNKIINTDDMSIDELFKFSKKSVNVKESNKQLFNILKVKIFSKKNSIYSNVELQNKIKDKLSFILGLKKKKERYIILTKPKTYAKQPKLTNGFETERRQIINNLIKLPVFSIKNKIFDYNLYTLPNIFFICENTGIGHIWNTTDTTLICNTCNKKYEDFIDMKWNKTFDKSYDNTFLQKIATSYCSKNTDCVKCDEESIIIKDNVEFTLCIHKEYLENVNENNKLLLDNENKEIEKEERENDIIISLKEEMDKNKDYLKVFLDILDKNLDKNIFNNIYYITHTHLGDNRKKDVEVDQSKIELGTDADNVFFESNVISVRHGNIEYFYDRESLRYVGHKQGTGSYIKHVSRESIYLKELYSAKNILFNLGINKQFYNKKMPHKEYIDIGKDRNINIKKIVRDFHIFIYNVRFKIQVQTSQLKKTDRNLFLKKYEFDLAKLKLDDDIFEDWEIYFKKLFFNDAKFENDNVEKLKVLVETDLNNNILHYYFIRELTKLIKNNLNKEHILCNFIYDYITLFYNKQHPDLDISDKALQYIIENIDPEQIYYEYFKSDDIEPDLYTDEIDETGVIEDRHTEEGYDMYDNDNDKDDMSVSQLD